MPLADFSIFISTCTFFLYMFVLLPLRKDIFVVSVDFLRQFCFTLRVKGHSLCWEIFMKNKNKDVRMVCCSSQLCLWDICLIFHHVQDIWCNIAYSCLCIRISAYIHKDKLHSLCYVSVSNKDPLVIENWKGQEDIHYTYMYSNV